jgi:DNA (cytosine-5)-methyltransferase 1
VLEKREELGRGEYNQTCSTLQTVFKFYDFFAGAGLTRLALSRAWRCIWANDIDERKAEVYGANFPGEPYVCKDIAEVSLDELPDGADMAWASFPCQDLSLAGWRRGLSAERSGTFWQFWRLMYGQFEVAKRPPLIVIENVVGLLYGDNFTGLCEALAALGMQFGAVVMDAKRFLPQSRPRVFVVAADARLDVERFCVRIPNPVWAPPPLMRSAMHLPDGLHSLWRWWHLPVPLERKTPLSRIIESKPTLVDWHNPEETRYILSLMNETNLGKITAARRLKGKHIGFMYKRIREGKQRAEIRFDGISGCLRTPQGGSSRQTVFVVEDGEVRSRLLSPREAARLMGTPDSFVLPDRYNDGYKAMGDGVAVPVVQWLSKHLLEPLAALSRRRTGGGLARPHVDDSVRNSHQRAIEWSMLNGKSEHRRDRA